MAKAKALFDPILTSSSANSTLLREHDARVARQLCS